MRTQLITIYVDGMNVGQGNLIGECIIENLESSGIVGEESSSMLLEMIEAAIIDDAVKIEMDGKTITWDLETPQYEVERAYRWIKRHHDGEDIDSSELREMFEIIFGRSPTLGEVGYEWETLKDAIPREYA